MALYHRQMIHWPLKVGDYVGYFLNPFIDYKVDAVFRVLDVSPDNMFMTIIVVRSTYLSENTVYFDQPTKGFKKVKVTPLENDLTYGSY